MDEYYRAVRALPAWLAAPLAQLPAQTAARVQELRLRTGCAVTFTVQGRQCSASALPGCPPALAAMRLDALQIEEIFHTLCNGSVHTHERELSEGYLTTAAGNRVGVAGQFVQREGHGITLQKVTSLNLRIARSCVTPLPPALDKLLEKRSEVTPHAVQAFEIPTYPAHTVGQLPALAARFANAAQCPAEAAEKLQYLIFPIAEAESIPEAWRGKTLLELPRVMFGRLEQKTAARLDALQDAGFAGVVVNNPAQLRYTDGWTLYGGLGLNVTNPMSAARYASLGVQGMLLQPETALTAMQAVAPGVPTAALCYGHLPLMLTRACPLRNVRDCGKCPGGGTLRDRKGRDFTVTCSAPGGAGVRTVFNPVPLYMGERLRELPVDVAVAAFTTETPARVSQILDLLFNAQPFDSEFTRGLYYTNN